MVLADAGLTDNSGIRLMQAAVEAARATSTFSDWNVDLIIASEGGAMFGPVRDVTSTNVVGRAADVVYASASQRRSNIDVPIVELDPRPYAAYFAALESDSPDLKQYWAARASPAKDLLRIARLQSAASEYLLRVSRSGSRRSVLLERATDLRDFHEAVRRKSPVTAVEILQRIVDDVVEEDFRRCVRTYATTATLDDQIPAESVDALYRLGQYLVILKWQEIAAALKRPE